MALLKLNAVVGLKGTVETIDGRETLVRVGTTCALCHSTVNNSFAQGIGARLDGWPNSDLNPGAIIALSPALSTGQKAVYNSWGPGKYDPRFNFDGLNGPVVIPPAYGLLGVNSIIYTGDGPDLAYWRFTPMALMAYAQLDTVDADARYHAALLKVHTGEVEAARALGDTILAQAPGYLFGYIIRGTVARFRKDQKELARAYSGFLKRYDQETRLARAEYSEHQNSLDDFRKAALGATRRP